MWSVDNRRTWLRAFGRDALHRRTVLTPSPPPKARWCIPVCKERPTGLVRRTAHSLVGAYYFKGEAKYIPGTEFMGGGEQALLGDEAYGTVRALEALTGKLQLEFRLHSPPWAGLLSTAGGVVFGGTNEGNLFALDARTGKVLWDFQTGGAIRSNPISFSVDGVQYIASAAGFSVFVFALS